MSTLPLYSTVKGALESCMPVRWYFKGRGNIGEVQEQSVRMVSSWERIALTITLFWAINNYDHAPFKKLLSLTNEKVVSYINLSMAGYSFLSSESDLFNLLKYGIGYGTEPTAKEAGLKSLYSSIRIAIAAGLFFTLRKNHSSKFFYFQMLTNLAFLLEGLLSSKRDLLAVFNRYALVREGCITVKKVCLLMNTFVTLSSFRHEKEYTPFEMVLNLSNLSLNFFPESQLGISLYAGKHAFNHLYQFTLDRRNRVEPPIKWAFHGIFELLFATTWIYIYDARLSNLEKNAQERMGTPVGKIANTLAWIPTYFATGHKQVNIR